MTAPSDIDEHDSPDRWHNLAEINAIHDGESLECLVAGRVVALSQVAGKHYAIDGVCAHQGGPLGEGSMQGCWLKCPWHHLEFDVRSGASQINEAVRQQTFRVRLRADWIQVLMPDN